jgi:hypothetical protein
LTWRHTIPFRVTFLTTKSAVVNTLKPSGDNSCKMQDTAP